MSQILYLFVVQVPHILSMAQTVLFIVQGVHILDMLQAVSVYSPRHPYPRHTSDCTCALLIWASMPKNHPDTLLACSLHVLALISIFRYPESPYLRYALDAELPLAPAVYLTRSLNWPQVDARM